MKKVGMKSLGAALVAAAALGAAGPASADIYGLSRLQITNLNTEISTVDPVPDVQSWNFRTDASANLNPPGGPGTSESAVCSGFGSILNPAFSSNCPGGAGAATVLSQAAQNAPGGDGASQRGEDDFQIFGGGTQYSNAESSILDAQIVGDASTQVSLVSESNLTDGVDAGASSNVGSGTSLNLEFEVGPNGGEFAISFEAEWDVIAAITGGATGQASGIINANATLTGLSNNTFVQWVPTGFEVVTCVGPGGISCVASEDGNLNNIATTGATGTTDDQSGTGSFSLAVTGLESGSYSFSLGATTQTIVSQVPAPATLLLLGTGLLAGAGLHRRRKAA